MVEVLKLIAVIQAKEVEEDFERDNLVLKTIYECLKFILEMDVENSFKCKHDLFDPLA